MIFDFDPRFNRESINSKTSSRRLLEDILTSKIVDSMSFGTASNYNTRSYGSNHRILYEGVARLLSEVLVGTVDSLEDIEFSQLRAEFVSTRLMYLVFPDEKSLPTGDSHEETITFLLQTYEALLQGATKKAIDEVLNDISEGNAVVVSDIEGYLANIKSSILATTEFNTDVSVYSKHRHLSFTDEKGLGSTNKPLEYKWGDKLHTHDIIDGVIQPYVDEWGNSHTHNVYLGVPENILRLQSNLRKVFGVTKPAHIKTGEISSVVDEDNPILTQGKPDVFSPILGIDPNKTDEELITENTVSTNLPYSNQNASYGLVGASLGSFHQEDMRKAREGVYDDEFYGYVSGKTIRVWRTNVNVADDILILGQDENGVWSTLGGQKLRVTKVEKDVQPNDGSYTRLSASEPLLKAIRPLEKGSSAIPSIFDESTALDVVNGCLFPPVNENGIREGGIGRDSILFDGEPLNFQDSIYFCDLMANQGSMDNVDDFLQGYVVKLSTAIITVDTQISRSGLVLIRNNSSSWVRRSETQYETKTFINEWNNLTYAINLPSYIVKDMMKVVSSLPVNINDITVKVNGVVPDTSYHQLTLEHTNRLEAHKKQGFPLRIYDKSHETMQGILYTPLASLGDEIEITYPKANSEIRRFRELNSLEMTLNATRPRRKVSLSGREIGQNRVIETTSPLSYVLNDPQPISAQIKEQKIATYSAGVSDLLNTENQNLNSTYTLNSFSLNQTATQDQVFKSATKTLTTSNPKISFYMLGFRPSFITSVVDSANTSYTYTLNQDHLLVEGLIEEKTLTISGLSSNPFRSDLDWYKGVKLVEGQAFFKNADRSDLSNFRESTPESYMTNPLGLASNILDTLPNIDPVYTYTNNVITGVDLHDRIFVSDSLTHVDEIRSLYSMLDETTSGVEGEMVFYEDVITGYDLDGRDGFTDEYNPHNPQDEWLYPNPSLYVLGPTISGNVQVNTIPTYLFFGYFMLMDGNMDSDWDYYISIYRLDNGVKKYQTLTTITDTNGVDALQVSSNLPETNGSPLAYRFIEDDGFWLQYGNNSTTVYANASFNHIPNETYYIEVYFEEGVGEGGGARFLSFFSKGSNADVTLSDTIHNLNDQHFETQNEVSFLTGLGTEVTHTYQVSFTTNPGEILTFSSVEDPSANATKESENVGATYGSATYSPPANNYPQPVIERSTSWKDIFYPYNPETNQGVFFLSEESIVPKMTDSLPTLSMSFAPVELESEITFGDSLTWSLLLTPALITDSLSAIEDDLYAKFNYDHVFLNDIVSLPTSSLDWLLNLVAVSESDEVPSALDSITVPTYQRYVPSSTVPGMSDAHTARVPSLDFLGGSVSVEDDLLCSLAYLPNSGSDTVGEILDSSTASLSYTPVNLVNNDLPSLSDEAKAFISSFFLSDSTGEINDGVETSLSLTPIDETDEVPNINDTITVPVYQTLTLQEPIGSILDSLNVSIQLYQDLSDTVSSASDGLISLISSFSLSDTTPSITDLEATDLNYTPITLGPDTITFNDSAMAFISSTTQTEETGVSVSDGVSFSYYYTTPYLMIGVKYGAYSDDDNELFSVYTGNMDTLSYPAVIDLQPDSNGDSPVGIQNGTPNAYPVITNERTVVSLGPLYYLNSNADANIRIGPLVYDQTYKIYAYTEFDDSASNADIQISMKVGGTSSNPTAYLDSIGYTDLFSGTATSSDKFYIHEFYIRSSDMAVIFTADSPGTVFTFSSAQSVRLYMHFIYTYTNNLDVADVFKLREARTGATHSVPNGTNDDSTGWIEPDLHATQTGFSNFSQDGSYVYTHLPNADVPNTDNDAQCSWSLSVGTRYNLQLYVRDHNPDFEIYLEARTEDNGGTWDTEYSSSSSLTYTELINQDDLTRVRTDHFFTIRRDGFIIWEHDPQT